MPLSLSLVIPVYNNEHTLTKELISAEKVLKDICKEYEIIICDDASIDGTFDLLKKLKNNPRIHVIHHTKNKGIAETIKELYRSSKCEYTILFSIDGGWNTLDIKRLAFTITKRNVDMVIGQRKNKKYNFYRKSISLVYNILTYVFFHTKTYDAGSIKVFRTSLIKKITLQSDSVFFEAEFIIKAQKKGYKVIAIPIDHRQTFGKKGMGGAYSLVLHSFFDLLKLRLSYYL